MVKAAVAERKPYWYEVKVKRAHDIARLRPPSLKKGQRFETEQDAAEYSSMIRAALHNATGRLENLATTLSECANGYYVCAQPICPICARQYRRWLISELLRTAERQSTGARILNVYLKSYTVGQLKNADIAASHDLLWKRLQRSGCDRSTLIGGTELSYNARRSVWILHVHLLAIGVSDHAVGKLRKKFKGRVDQPVVSQALASPPQQLSYLQKFGTYHRPGMQRSQRRAKSYPLPPDRLRELTEWMTEHQFEDFLFLYGARRRGTTIQCRRLHPKFV
jgi:hypothetical protein